MHVTGLFIYPIKSCRGIQLQQAEVTPKGFMWDREFMVVDEKGLFLTQRKHPNLARVNVQIEGDYISLSTDENRVPPLQFQPTSNGKAIEVTVWRSHLRAIDQGDAVAAWFQTVLNTQENFRLVRQSPDDPRFVNPKYALQGNETVSFADGYPFLLVNTASLANLNQRLERAYQNDSQTVPMNRFRPNIIVDTDLPFAEDTWDSIQIDRVIFDLVKPCDRCIIITTNQTTGERNPNREPFKILSSFRSVPKAGILFGENMIPRNTGILKTRDRVEILS
ncbi:MOSC N-terminal beta barrel domain-containing protein [Lusitaniella coriacea LEGE 07157]|uniref:MOSC N-terminal beta barrel domain-containing protein n=1 Tax=Lusitaniella coriacea LEGE 07157 TaxID=945747 RepID=A0A8J7AZP8_9CYAN|nr:MOSC N-terminal beta barrel domain-containing protein [Lusitaniella coriacea]MBE9114345.1 MOSC N-terminal beta barrel domain-containing protein [Lusitaniella coriacea LEGE 07157]